MKWEKACLICNGKSTNSCIFCGHKVFRGKSGEEITKIGIRARADFMDQMDMGLAKVGGDCVSKEMPGHDGTTLKADPEANAKIMKELEQHRKWAMELYQKHQKGTSIKTIAESENLNPGLAKRIIDNQRKKLLRKEYESAS